MSGGRTFHNLVKEGVADDPGVIAWRLELPEGTSGWGAAYPTTRIEASINERKSDATERPQGGG